MQQNSAEVTAKATNEEEVEDTSNCRDITEEDILAMMTHVKNRKKGSKIISTIKEFAKANQLSWSICRSRYYHKKRALDEQSKSSEKSKDNVNLLPEYALKLIQEVNKKRKLEQVQNTSVIENDDDFESLFAPITPPQKVKKVEATTPSSYDVEQHMLSATRFENDAYRLIFFRLNPHISFTIDKPTVRNRNATIKFSVVSSIEIDAIVGKVASSFGFGSSKFKALQNKSVNPVVVTEYFDESFDIATFKPFTICNQEEKTKDQKFLVLSIQRIIEENTSIPQEEILDF